MDKPYPPRSDPQEHGRSLAGLRMFDSILNWLVGLFQLRKRDKRMPVPGLVIHAASGTRSAIWLLRAAPQSNRSWYLGSTEKN